MERCPWPADDAMMIAYHDTVWGVPVHDDRALFEKLVLDGFQAGLSWRIILHKTAGFQAAFDRFDPHRIAKWGPDKLAALAEDARIVRNKAKIAATVANAKAWIALRESGTTFDAFLWQFVGETRHNAWTAIKQVPAQTPESEAMAKALKANGFKFCGPTITYAFMQAVGMVNDHLVTCPRHRELGG